MMFDQRWLFVNRDARRAVASFAKCVKCRRPIGWQDSCVALADRKYVCEPCHITPPRAEREETNTERGSRLWEEWLRKSNTSEDRYYVSLIGRIDRAREKAERERDEWEAKYLRARDEREAALAVTTTEGLSASEWLLRTGMAESGGRRAEARARAADGLLERWEVWYRNPSCEPVALLVRGTKDHLAGGGGGA